MQNFLGSATGGAFGAQPDQAQQNLAMLNGTGTTATTGTADVTQPSMGGNAAQTQAFQNALVAPNQMAPQTWNNLTPSQQQMLLGTWESQGYTQDDAKALFQQSLPKYATQSVGAGSFKLQ